MVDYARAQATARRLIRGSGRPVDFVKLKTTLADASKPLDGPAADTAEDPENRLAGVYATFVPLASNVMLGVTSAMVELIKTSEQMALVEVPEGGQDIRDYHVIVDGNVRYKVDRIEALRPGDTMLMYYVGVTRLRLEA